MQMPKNRTGFVLLIKFLKKKSSFFSFRRGFLKVFPPKKRNFSWSHSLTEKQRTFNPLIEVQFLVASSSERFGRLTRSLVGRVLRFERKDPGSIPGGSAGQITGVTLFYLIRRCFCLHKI